MRDEHVSRKKTVPRILRDNPDRLPVFFIRSCIAVLNKSGLPPEIGRHTLMQGIEMILGIFDVDLSPPDVAGRLSLVNHILVFRGTPHVLPHGDDQRAEVGHLALIAAHGVFLELRGGSVPIDISQAVQIHIMQAVIRNQIVYFHGLPPLAKMGFWNLPIFI